MLDCCSLLCTRGPSFLEETSTINEDEVFANHGADIRTFPLWRWGCVIDLGKSMGGDYFGDVLVEEKEQRRMDSATWMRGYSPRNPQAQEYRNDSVSTVFKKKQTLVFDQIESFTKVIYSCNACFTLYSFSRQVLRPTFCGCGISHWVVSMSVLGAWEGFVKESLLEEAGVTQQLSGSSWPVFCLCHLHLNEDLTSTKVDCTFLFRDNGSSSVCQPTSARDNSTLYYVRRKYRPADTETPRDELNLQTQAYRYNVTDR